MEPDFLQACDNYESETSSESNKKSPIEQAMANHKTLLALAKTHGSIKLSDWAIDIFRVFNVVHDNNIVRITQAVFSIRRFHRNHD